MCRNMNRRSIVALLTDFGWKDPYVAAMKGVIVSRSHAELIDLSHEITPFDPFEAGWFLRMVGPTLHAGNEFLDRMVVVAVVDPGVGTSRRILAALDHGCFYLAPDNGLLSLALSPRATFASVETSGLFLPGGSTTFHGRDRFAPVAAALAEATIGFEDLGPTIERAEIVSIDYHEPRRDERGITGTVVAIDGFGNIVTDIDAGGLDLSSPIEISIGGHVIRTFSRSYGEGSRDEPFAIVGSRGTIEISMNMASAADRLQSERLSEVRLSWPRRGA